jgi:hypothetical protein
MLRLNSPCDFQITAIESLLLENNQMEIETIFRIMRSNWRSLFGSSRVSLPVLHSVLSGIVFLEGVVALPLTRMKLKQFL